MQDAYRKRMESYVRELRADLEKLAARAERGEAETRIAAGKLAEDLRRRFEPVEETLEKVRDAGADAWDDAKDALEAAVRRYVSARTEALGREGVPPEPDLEAQPEKAAGPGARS